MPLADEEAKRLLVARAQALNELGIGWLDGVGDGAAPLCAAPLCAAQLSSMPGRPDVI
jgi:hypothetical protein